MARPMCDNFAAARKRASGSIATGSKDQSHPAVISAEAPSASTPSSRSVLWSEVESAPARPRNASTSFPSSHCLLAFPPFSHLNC